MAFRRQSATAAEAATGDVLVALAHKGGATALVNMLCVSHTWRQLLLAEGGDRLWQRLAMERFPRLRFLLQHTPVMHTFRAIYRQQLAAENIRAQPTPPLPPPAPLSAYIFAMEWRTAGGIVGSWSGEVPSLDVWLPVQWSGPLTALEQMRSNMRVFFAAGEGVADESQEEFERRYYAYLATHPLSFTVVLSVMRRSDLATLLLSQPEDEQEIYDSIEEDPLKPRAVTMQTQNCSPPPGGSMAYGLIDQWHIDSAEQEERFSTIATISVAHAALQVNPGIRIGSDDFAERGVTVDAMRLGFTRRHFPADLNAHGVHITPAPEHDVPVTRDEVLRYLAYGAPWPAPVT
jgi:hypothetical protein